MKKLAFILVPLFVFSHRSFVRGNHDRCLRLLPSLDPYVCGSDHKSYMSMEHFKCHQRHQTELEFVHFGICRKDEMRPMAEDCLPEHNFAREGICANDGHTYHDQFQFRCFQEFWPDLQVLHYGICQHGDGNDDVYDRHPGDESEENNS